MINSRLKGAELDANNRTLWLSPNFRAPGDDTYAWFIPDDAEVSVDTNGDPACTEDEATVVWDDAGRSVRVWATTTSLCRRGDGPAILIENLKGSAPPTTVTVNPDGAVEVFRPQGARGRAWRSICWLARCLPPPA